MWCCFVLCQARPKDLTFRDAASQEPGGRKSLRPKASYCASDRLSGGGDLAFPRQFGEVARRSATVICWFWRLRMQKDRPLKSTSRALLIRIYLFSDGNVAFGSPSISLGFCTGAELPSRLGSQPQRSQFEFA